MISKKFPIEPDFWLRVYSWSSNYNFACILDGNGHDIPFGQAFGKIAAFGKREHEWKEGEFFDCFAENQKGTSIFGYLGYDLKNEIEPLSSSRIDNLKFPNAIFFEADVILEEKDGHFEIKGDNPDKILNEILSFKPFSPKSLSGISFSKTINQIQYSEAIKFIKNLISNGMVYELNYCQFFESAQDFCGLSAFVQLKESLPMPFSGWFKGNEFEIASASPERFLKKTGSKLLSQPMKGTAKRGKTEEEDLAQKAGLLASEKERAENLMIVDLVRNDLAKVSKPGSTKVDELFGIYPFPTVFQMVSTVSSELRDGNTWVDALISAFPMGSMTGAPKIEVMKQIEGLETRKRGAFSGALGYVAKDQDFDFNVLIRSLFINHKLKRAGFAVGSAITIDSDSNEEWLECRNKASGVLKIFGIEWEELQLKNSIDQKKIVSIDKT